MNKLPLKAVSIITIFEDKNEPIEWMKTNIMLSQRLSEPFKGKQQCPGGKTDKCLETIIPKKAVIREFYEETGLLKLPNKFKYLFEYIGYDGTGKVKVYQINLPEKDWLKIANYQENDKVTSWKLHPIGIAMYYNLLDSVRLWYEKNQKWQKIPQIISINGINGSGKTTLINKLIDDLYRRGFKVYLDKSKDLIENKKTMEAQVQICNKRYDRLIPKKDKDYDIVLTEKDPMFEWFYHETHDWIDQDDRIILQEWALEYADELYQGRYMMILVNSAHKAYDNYKDRGSDQYDKNSMTKEYHE